LSCDWGILYFVPNAVDGTGLMRLSLPSLVMINLDWTSVTEAISLDFLRENGVCVCVCAVCVSTCAVFVHAMVGGVYT
jgi:hypothetical protein